MRILIISHAYVSAYHQQKIEELAKHKDLEIFLMAPEFSIEGGGRKIYLEKTVDPNYKVIPVKTYFSGKWNTYLIKNLKSYLKKIKPDIIHLEEEYWTNVAWQIQKEPRNFPRAKIILFTWENLYHDWRAEADSFYQKIRFGIFSSIEKKVLRKADLIIAGNQEAAGVLRKKGYNGLVEVVPQFGTNNNYFVKKDVAGLKKELGLENCFVAGYIGRVTKEKGIEDFIRAAIKVPLANDKGEKIKFLIIGNGGFKKEAIELARELKLEDRFVFRDAVDFKQIVEYYNLMGVMVIPSRTMPEWKEQFGRTIIEAMSCGVPVVGSDSGAIPEVVGEAGLIFKESDVDGLAAKIADLISREDLRSDLINKGSKRVKENFTTKIIAQKTYQIYQQLMTL